MSGLHRRSHERRVLRDSDLLLEPFKETLHYRFLMGTAAALLDGRIEGPGLIYTRDSNALVENEDGNLQYAPHQLMQNTNLTDVTGELPAGYIDQGTDGTRTYASQGTYNRATFTLTGTSERVGIRTNPDTTSYGLAQEADYTIFFNVISMTGGGVDGGNVLFTQFLAGTGVIAAVDLIDVSNGGAGWYACVINTGDDPSFRIGVGGSLDNDAAYTLVWEKVGLIKGDFYDLGAGNSGGPFTAEPLGRWVGTDNGDEPIHDQPRFDHDPADVNSASLGLLFEGYARTNLFLHSQEQDDADWTQTAQVAVTPDDAVAPDGTTTADLLTNSGDDATSTQAVTVTAADRIVVSAWVNDSVAGGTFHIEVDGASGTADAWFDVATAGGVVGTKSATSYTDNALYVEDWGGGWIRCVFDVTTITDTAITCRFIIADGDASDTEDTTDAMHVWGAQVEVVGATEPFKATSYIPTFAATATRARDTLTSSDLSWLHLTAGTFYMDGTPGGVAHADQYFFSIPTGTTNPNIYLHIDVSGTEMDFVMAPGIGLSGTQTINTDNQRLKAAWAWSDIGNELHTATNGTTNGSLSNIDAGNDASGINHTFPYDNIKIGNRRVLGAHAWTGHIAEFKFWPVQKTEAFLFDVTI